MQEIDVYEKENMRQDLPVFDTGDTVKVHYKISESGRERIQVFQGTVIRKQGSGIKSTFTVRKISFGVGVEKTFPLHSPRISKIEVSTKGKVRRARLYYLREKIGKASRIKEKRQDS